MADINTGSDLIETVVNPLEEGLHETKINGLNVRYEIKGKGSPFLLMHGWECSLETVRSIADVASRTNLVVNIDLPGFGKSVEPEEIWGVEDYTRFIEMFVEKLGLKNPIIAGHSFGGRIGILFSSRNPVEKLILIDAAGVKPKRPLKYYLRVYTFKTAKALLKTFLPQKVAEKKIEALRSKRGSADYNSASQKMKSILSKVVNEDLKHVMPSIKAPTLLIWGAKDTATPLSDAKIMEKLIPGAGLVVFDNAGHYSFLDNRYGFNAVLSSFLNSKS